MPKPATVFANTNCLRYQQESDDGKRTFHCKFCHALMGHRDLVCPREDCKVHTYKTPALKLAAANRIMKPTWAIPKARLGILNGHLPAASSSSSSSRPAVKSSSRRTVPGVESAKCWLKVRNGQGVEGKQCKLCSTWLKTQAPFCTNTACAYSPLGHLQAKGAKLRRALSDKTGSRSSRPVSSAKQSSSTKRPSSSHRPYSSSLAAPAASSSSSSKPAKKKARRSSHRSPSPPSHVAIRVSSANLQQSQQVLRESYALVEAATEARREKCPVCAQDYISTPSAAIEAAETSKTFTSVKGRGKHSDAAAAAASSSAAAAASPSTAAAASSSVAHSADRSPRVLSCGHGICTACVHAATSSHSKLTCATCEKDHLPKDSTPPFNFALIASLQAHTTFLAQLRSFHTQTTRLCNSAENCASVAMGAGLTDERSLVELEVALADQKAAQLVALRKKRLEQLAAQKIEDDKYAEEKKKLGKSAKERRRNRKRHRSRSVSSSSSSSSSSDGEDAADDQSSSFLTDESALASSATSFGHQGISMTVTDTLKERLQHWLGDIASLASTRLIYHADTHGWTAADFFHHCSHKGSTLLLAKVAGNGYVFGAFINIDFFRPASSPVAASSNGAAPAAAATSSANVLSNCFDSSYRSFLFSLSNPAAFPFRMTLTKQRGPAIITHPTFGPMFGGRMRQPDGRTVQWPNLSLCWYDRAGNEKDSNICNDPDVSNCAYQYEADHGYPQPPKWRCDQEAFSGAQMFQLEQMEVYSIRVTDNDHEMTD